MRKALISKHLSTILVFKGMVGVGGGGDFAIITRRQNMRDLLFARIPKLLGLT